MPACLAAIISDLTTRILTPAGKQAAGEMNSLIENIFLLNIDRNSERNLQNAYVCAKGILKEKNKDWSRK